MTVQLNRRLFLGSAGIAAGIAPLSGCADGSSPFQMLVRDAEAAPDLSSTEGQLKSILRMSASLNPEDCPWWFNGTIYGMVEGEQPNPLFDFEGMEIYQVTKLGENVYEMTGNTVTFFRDHETKEFLYSYKNPYTNKTLDVPASVQGGGPGRGFTYELSGIRPTVLKDKMPDNPPKFDWNIAAGKVWVHSSRSYPPGMTPPRAERQTTFVPLKDFKNPRLAKLPTVFSSTFFAPWIPWLEMEGKKGHMIWHAGGAKLDTIADLPKEYRDRVENEYPERMTGKPAAGTGGKKVE